MKKFLAAVLVTAAVSLGGCTDADVARAVATFCKFEPDAVSLEKLITSITGLPPGAQIGIDVFNQLVSQICAAANTQPGTAGRALLRKGQIQLNVQGHPLTGRRL